MATNGRVAAAPRRGARGRRAPSPCRSRPRRAPAARAARAAAPGRRADASRSTPRRFRRAARPVVAASSPSSAAETTSVERPSAPRCRPARGPRGRARPRRTSRSATRGPRSRPPPSHTRSAQCRALTVASSTTRSAAATSRRRAFSRRAAPRGAPPPRPAPRRPRLPPAMTGGISSGRRGRAGSLDDSGHATTSSASTTLSRPRRARRVARESHASPAARSDCLADGDAERLAEREVLLAHREHEQLLHLLRRRQVARELRLGGDDLLGDLEVGAEQEPRAASR